MDILPLHASTGCDTVSGLFNIGKLKPLSVLQKDSDEHLNFLGDISNNNFDEIYTRCVNFMSKCDGRTPCDTMNDLMYKYWVKLIGAAKSLCPPLKHLPPTDPSFREHVKRAICQLNIWENADKGQPIGMVCSWKSIDANHDTRQYCSSTRFRTEVDKMCMQIC